MRQQALLAELGRRALTDTPLDVLLEEAARLTALGLDTQYCKVLEYLPDQNRLLVRAGVGWHDGVVGAATVGADLDSPAGYAIHTGKPVISNRLSEEQRFRTPQLLAEHGIARAINVILMGENRPFGVLEADSQTEGAFSEHDIDFMQGVANLLGLAIDHRRTLEALKSLNQTLENRVEAESHTRRATEEALRQSQKMEAVGQLTGGIAHDFNNLLTVIGGNLDLIAEKGRGDPELAYMIAAAQKSADRGQQLTTQLLSFARRQALHPETRSVNELVREFDALTSRILGETIDMEVILGPDAGSIHVDPAQFGSALLNLVVNARDAMQHGGQLRIETGNVVFDQHQAAQLDPGAASGPYAWIFVADTGSGMSPETLEHAVEPFFTTKGPGKGTGLGLSQVYGFVHQSGGFLSIDSAPGKGTEVRIYLPSSSIPARTGVMQASEDAPPSGSEALLVVEDDADVCDFIVQSLNGLGYRVLVARSGPEALNILERERSGIDLVLTDMIMPGGLTGVELIREVRRLHPGIGVLLVSGYTAGNELVGPDGDLRSMPLLAKPFRRPDLARAVRAALDRSDEKPGR